jgi:hypothetical protein
MWGLVELNTHQYFNQEFSSYSLWYFIIGFVLIVLSQLSVLEKVLNRNPKQTLTPPEKETKKITKLTLATIVLLIIIFIGQVLT